MVSIAHRYSYAKAKHNIRRNNPSRDEYTLRTIVSELGLRVPMYEFEVTMADARDGKGVMLWYDIACIDTNGDMLLIDIEQHYQGRGLGKRNQRVEMEKKQWAEMQGIPLIKVRAGSKVEMRVKLELELIKRRLS